MRYPSTLSLALIVHVLLSIVGLMILACTATPATPTPFTCQELADKLASAQTETAAYVLTSTWDESGCTKKAAGEQFYKDVPVTVEVTRVVPVTVPVTKVVEVPVTVPVTRVVVKEVPVTKIIRETTIIMVTPELARNSSLAGTTWRFTKTPNYNRLPSSSIREFLIDGTWCDLCRTGHSWEQSGDIVHIYAEDKYSTEIGTVSGDSMSGTGSNVVGQSWTWEAFIID